MCAAALLTLSGCARLVVYKDAAMTTETGFKVYTAKPYVLAAYTGGDKPVEVTIQYLPDLSEPMYVKPRPGVIGTSNLTMTLSNGMLVSFGQESDTKLPELITSIGDYRKAIAEAAASGLRTSSDGTAPAPPTFKLYEVVYDAGSRKVGLKEVTLP
jgi:hypothetical protein